jgi:sulfur carrier protein
MKLQPMKLQVNGETKAYTGPLTLLSLISNMGLKPDRVAVELNGEIVARDQWENMSLSDGDRLEIVHFVGGGAACYSRRRSSRLPGRSESSVDSGIEGHSY